MAYLVLVILVQVVTIAHVLRSGRNPLWVLGILLAPILGSLVYLLLEVLPGMQGNKHIRYARQKAIAKIDPEREVRAARTALELTESVGNRTRLADALAVAGRHDEAVVRYAEIAAIPQARDDALLSKYASALFEDGRASEALAIIEQVEIRQSSIGDRQSLLRARIYEELGRDEEALAIFADLAPRMAGIETRSRYAALLIKQGCDGEARAQLQEVMRSSREMDRTQIGDDRPIIDWAKATLRGMEE